MADEQAAEVVALRDELAALLNGHSAENGSDTPDFILADYMLNCLSAFDVAVTARTQWYTPPKTDE